MIDALFIAGTDTEVGKTVVSKAILQALAAQDLSTIGYKPVAAGCEQYPEGLRNSDASASSRSGDARCCLRRR